MPRSIGIMRQLAIQVPRGHGAEVLRIAQRHGGSQLSCVGADAPEGPVDVVAVHVPNRAVEGLLAELDPLEGPRIALAPHGVVVLRPPDEDVAEQVREVQQRSPVEVWLSGLQSVGSWTGFLGYAVAAGVVTWIGLYTGTSFLLVAAMLIAPFAGPAMNAALATARGDGVLFRRSVLRYVASLLVTVCACWLLSVVFQQERATPLMVERSRISFVAALLPLTAGAAGALNLLRSERDSLVSGAATGMLIAASLAPPAGLVGMGAAIGAWDMVRSGVFLVVLQLAGINVAGAIVFRLGGVSTSGARYPHGSAGVAWSAWLGGIALFAALLAWQFSDRPALQRASQAQRIAAEVRDLLARHEAVVPVEVQARFAGTGAGQQDTVLILAYATTSAAGRADDDLRRRLEEAVTAHVRARFAAEPAVAVTLLASDADGGAP